jgi:hypothetical protein
VIFSVFSLSPAAIRSPSSHHLQTICMDGSR